MKSDEIISFLEAQQDENGEDVDLWLQYGVTIEYIKALEEKTIRLDGLLDDVYGLNEMEDGDLE